MVLLQTILVLVSVLAEKVERRDCAGRVSGETEGSPQGDQWTEPEMENHSRAGVELMRKASSRQFRSRSREMG